MEPVTYYSLLCLHARYLKYNINFHYIVLEQFMDTMKFTVMIVNVAILIWWVGQETGKIVLN